MRGKVSTEHLQRRAFVYVRQSTAAQVHENVESTRRQYALVERAKALGWAADAIEVIDEDLGKSGASTDGRDGFARLVDAVAYGEAGAVLALEVSRLARCSQDWQRLMSLCAVAQVALVDESSVYDPNDRDDKLLLDLKGTMSEAELHWLRLRLVGARRNKARRGELRTGAVATGYVWTGSGYVKDPDEAVRRAIEVVFARFAVEPSAWAVVRWARETGFQMPTRRELGGGSTEVEWRPLGTSRLCDLLRNPVYAGAYVYGRRPARKELRGGEIRQVRASGLEPGQWFVKLEGAHEGYLDWETYLGNQEKLRQNLARLGAGVRGAPREGPALLPGLAVCGRCGRRMRPQYMGRSPGGWRYYCVGERDRGQTLCWSVPGAAIDEAVEALFLRTVVPEEVELSLAVERETESQSEELARQWRARLEQAEYEARRAERRYKAVEPENRVVARTLEREWEARLQDLEELDRQYRQAGRKRVVSLTDDDRARVRELAGDLPAVWRSSTTTPAERKAMLRLAIEAVALSPMEVPRRATRVQVQWQSGAVTEVVVPWLSRRERTQTPTEAVARIRDLAGAREHDSRIADRLNAEGLRTGQGKTWNLAAVKWARRRNGIKRTAPDDPRRVPLPDQREDGLYSMPGVCRRFGVTAAAIEKWLANGLLHGRREDYGHHRNVWWFDLDDATAARIEARKGPRSWREPSRSAEDRSNPGAGGAV